jgi:hypothetical protein
MVLAAQAAPQAEKKDAKKERTPEKAHIESDSADFDTKAKLWRFRTNVVLKHKDATFYCDQADVDKKENTAEARGHLRVLDPDNLIVGDLVQADFDDSSATLLGNVTLTHEKGLNAPPEKRVDKPAAATPSESKEPAPPPQTGSSAQSEASQPSADVAEGAAPTVEPAEAKPEDETEIEKAKRKKTVITCDKIVFYYDEDRAEAWTNVVAKQEDRTVYTSHAVYDETIEVLYCDGPTRVTTEDGDDLTVAGAIVYYNEDRMTVEGLSGYVAREKKEKGAEQAGAAAEAEAAKPPTTSPPAQVEPQAKLTPPAGEAK